MMVELLEQFAGIQENMFTPPHFSGRKIGDYFNEKNVLYKLKSIIIRTMYDKLGITLSGYGLRSRGKKALLLHTVTNLAQKDDFRVIIYSDGTVSSYRWNLHEVEKTLFVVETVEDLLAKLEVHYIVQNAKLKLGVSMDESKRYPNVTHKNEITQYVENKKCFDLIRRVARLLPFYIEGHPFGGDVNAGPDGIYVYLPNKYGGIDINSSYEIAIKKDGTGSFLRRVFKYAEYKDILKHGTLFKVTTVKELAEELEKVYLPIIALKRFGVQESQNIFNGYYDALLCG